ncbi:hypothetical protein pb186bvf_014699 [Paramecium bursaria]
MKPMRIMVKKSINNLFINEKEFQFQNYYVLFLQGEQHLKQIQQNANINLKMYQQSIHLNDQLQNMSQMDKKVMYLRDISQSQKNLLKKLSKDV